MTRRVARSSCCQSVAGSAASNSAARLAFLRNAPMRSVISFKKNADPALLLILNQIFVTFGVYLIIEIQVRYIYFVQISVLIAAATGFAVLYDTGRKLFLQRKK